MDSLFGISLTSIMVALLLLMAGTLAVLGWIVWRNPLLARMGLRNVARRRAQTTLIVVGLMLSTLIISAAFATGDTVGFSVTTDVYNSLEEADVLLVFDDEAGATRDTLTAADLAAIRGRFGADPAVDGITGIVIETLPALNREARLSEPQSQFVGVDPLTVDSFRGLREPGGALVSASALGGNRAFITERLADELDAASGDTVTVFQANQPHDFEVIGIVRDTSIAGAPPAIFGDGGRPSGGIVVHIDTARSVTARPGELDVIALSVIGGTRDSVARIGPVEERLEDYLAANGVPAEVAFTKEDVVAIGELIGSIFVTFFLVFGLFSIAAGVMLIFLIFVMLAAERRSEMGMARAVGMKRTQLTQMFLAEGMAYNLGSAAVGAVLGLAVAYALVFVMGQIFGEFGLSISFHFNPQGFVIAYGLGVVLTFATVAFSAYRAANINIVRAIRDLPEPQPLRGADRSLRGVLQAAAGALWTVAWIVLVTVWAVIGFQLFVLGLAFYGIPFIVGGLVAGWFVFGARAASRPFAATRGWWRRALYVLWWIVFLPMALLTWALLLTRGPAARRRNAGGWAVLMLAFGLLLVYSSGWESAEAIPGFGSWMQGKAFGYTGGTTLAVLALAMLAVYFGAASRVAFTVAGALLVWYWLLPLPFSLFSDAGIDIGPIRGLFRVLGLPPPVDQEGNIEMFFVSGISITASATLVVIFNADRLLGVVRALGGMLGGVAPAIKTAVAYPLAAKFRTAMTLAMFGLIVFSLVVMSFLNHNFTQLFLGDEARVGFDVVAEANASNRIPDLRRALADEGFDVDASVAGAGRLTTTFPLVRAAGDDDFRRYRLQGADDEFLRLAELPMQFRATGYDSDAAVIEALRTDPTVAVIDATRLRQPRGFAFEGDDVFELPVSGGDLRDAAWDPIPLALRRPEGNERLTLSIIAVLEPQVNSVLPQLLAIVTGDAAVSSFFEGGEQETFFLTTVGGSKESADAAAKAIESALLERGVQAESIHKIIDDAAGQSTAFQLLFEAFMGLGLVVGIAALGVIAFRTVVERRQQIGMLRAIGYTRRLIGISFFLESSFIALTGIVMGLVLGSALSYNLLTSPDFTEGAELDFRVPWLRIVLISVVAYGASAAMTIIPARSASRVVPAEALRYE